MGKYNIKGTRVRKICIYILKKNMYIYIKKKCF